MKKLENAGVLKNAPSLTLVVGVFQVGGIPIELNSFLLTSHREGSDGCSDLLRLERDTRKIY